MQRRITAVAFLLKEIMPGIPALQKQIQNLHRSNKLQVFSIRRFMIQMQTKKKLSLIALFQEII